MPTPRAPSGDAGAALGDRRPNQGETPAKLDALPLGTMHVADKQDLFAFDFEDFSLEGYRAHPSIPAPIAV